MGFTVAAIVNEPTPVLTRFVRWYLTQGAQQVQLYFDAPDHAAVTALRTDPRVTTIPCTPAFWHSIGIADDARFTRRQNAVLTHAYHALRQGWLLNVDADELMYAQNGTLADWLATRTDAQTIRIATAEHVHGPGNDLLFRLPIPRNKVNEIFDGNADLFRRRFGLIGHADGKSFHRSGRSDIRLRQHWSEDAAGDEVQGARLGGPDGIYLLHFIAPDYAAWRAKLDWRLGSHGFPDPIKQRLHQIAETADPEAGYKSLFDLLHAITPAQLAALESIGGILRLPAEFA